MVVIVIKASNLWRKLDAFITIGTISWLFPPLIPHWVVILCRLGCIWVVLELLTLLWNEDVIYMLLFPFLVSMAQIVNTIFPSPQWRGCMCVAGLRFVNRWSCSFTVNRMLFLYHSMWMSECYIRYDFQLSQTNHVPSPNEQNDTASSAGHLLWLPVSCVVARVALRVGKVWRMQVCMHTTRTVCQNARALSRAANSCGGMYLSQLQASTSVCLCVVSNPRLELHTMVFLWLATLLSCFRGHVLRFYIFISSG